MTHPLDIGFVNCQQISVLPVPAHAFVGPGPVSSGEWHPAEAAAHGALPFPAFCPTIHLGG